MRSVRVTVHGRVQGVGFRWFVQDAAQAHGVAGWVRNHRGGTVEAELHGADADVQAVLDLLAQGPAGAQVTEVAVSEAFPASSSGFEIRGTA
ncbi:acylphosphatase [Microbacterium aerolatum]|uniref:acylphosphatase n=1 Tax=Microbacterium aerolatum TaxID=153731 RepID=UPI00200195F4|nr:acylphosphatase [Microbacterium aerolatum]MCK3768914.1 acylphosphatase [Microbacterium aerolatum]